jgi:hypothetical protein
MRRRDFLGILAGTVVAWPFARRIPTIIDRIKTSP